MNYYISDLHIGHKKILECENRPFSTIEEMEKVIIENWNNTVTASDNVYILGDMFWNRVFALRILPQLNGNKYLVKGNHDSYLNEEISKYFVWVKDYAEIKDNGELLILCHYPLAHWRNQEYGTIHLYGHIHKGLDRRPFLLYVDYCKRVGKVFECYNVGVMLPYVNYTPRTLDELKRYGGEIPYEYKPY